MQMMLQLKKHTVYWQKNTIPTCNPGDKEAEQKFKEASEAYAVLSDPRRDVSTISMAMRHFDGSAGGPVVSISTIGFGRHFRRYFRRWV